MTRFADLLFVTLAFVIAISAARKPSSYFVNTAGSFPARPGPGYGGDAELDASPASSARTARECNATDLDAGDRHGTAPQERRRDVVDPDAGDEDEDDDASSAGDRPGPAGRRRRHLRRSDADRSAAADERNLGRGSIVELRAEGDYLAAPAIVLGSRIDENDSSTTRYSVQNLITEECLSDVESRLVHPYEAYADGTRAYCNVGEDPAEGVRTTPCVVDSHSMRKSGVVLYRVSYLDGEGGDALVEDWLPFSRVRRIHGRRSFGSRMK